MRGIAKKAAAKILALTAVFMFALCASIAAGSTQEAYADWDSSHTHYWNGETMVTDDIIYVPEDDAWYYFKPSGLVGTGWCSYDWGEPSWCYGDPSTGKLKFGWQKIGGYWYYFAPYTGWTDDGRYDYVIGTMYHHGIARINGKWYYFGKPDSGSKWGKMQFGWTSEINGNGDKIWYYADPNKDGQLAVGWKKISGKWYYFEPSEYGSGHGDIVYYYGEMHHGQIETINGHPYYFAKSGALGSGWIKEAYSYTYYDGTSESWADWYYADPNNDSRLVKGWKKISGYWYYFGSDYEMYDNATSTINDKLYVFDRSGKLPNKEGWYNLYEEYTEADGTVVKDDYWVYSNKSGIATTGWKKISGYWYYFDQYGYMKYDQWVSDSKGECYLQPNGKMAVSKWIKEGTNWRYVDETGHMLKNTTKQIGGNWYAFDEDGYMIPG